MECKFVLKLRTETFRRSGCDALDLCRKLRVTETTNIEVGHWTSLVQYEVPESFARERFDHNETAITNLIDLDLLRPGDVEVQDKNGATLVFRPAIGYERAIELVRLQDQRDAHRRAENERQNHKEQIERLHKEYKREVADLEGRIEDLEDQLRQARDEATIER